MVSNELRSYNIVLLQYGMTKYRYKYIGGVLSQYWTFDTLNLGNFSTEHRKCNENVLSILLFNIDQHIGLVPYHCFFKYWTSI